MQKMKLTTSELKCLRLIATHSEARVLEIGRELQALPSHVSRVLAALKQTGFVTIEKVGLSKVVSLSETKHAILWKKMMIEYGHMPLHELFSGSSLEVLSAICCLKLRNRKEIQENSLVSEVSVAKTLQTLRLVGIVQKLGSIYGVSPRFQTLKDFVMEFRHYLNQRIALEFAADAVVLWECNSEFIVESQESEEGHGFLKTSTSSFGDFGIQLLSPKSFFFYSPFVKRLRLEDAILHFLLVEHWNMLPVLLVWKRNERRIDMKYLERQSEKYGVTNSVNGIVAYFVSGGLERTENFPAWDEFAAKAKEYGIL